MKWAILAVNRSMQGVSLPGDGCPDPSAMSVFDAQRLSAMLTTFEIRKFSIDCKAERVSGEFPLS